MMPYRLPAADLETKLEALIDPDSLERAWAAHRRRAAVFVVLGTLAIFALLRAALATEDLVVMARFRASPTEAPLQIRASMPLAAHVAAASTLAVRELDALTACPNDAADTSSAQLSLSGGACVRFPAQPLD